MEGSDLSDQIKAFAREHEEEIKQTLVRKLDEFLACTITANYEAKWDAGVKEHGPMTLDVLKGLGWASEQASEFMDAFWYETLQMYRDSLSSGGQR